MFMRNRGHTCDMCMHIDEHHYKRHHEMCEQIRGIYEACGEDWPIIPEDEDDQGRAMFRDTDTRGSDDLSNTSGDVVPLKKRERKEHKRQMRAASRSKVVTQDDIRYIDSVLHPAASQAANGNPDNPEEIEEIEQHLKYNAQCYNDGQKRSDIRLFAHIPDADIDFGAEINRILEILHIAELLKRNERNRGLRKKELSNFKTLVSEFKDLVIMDLVQAKKDELEIRMRRASFLRYTNRASYDIMANRYAAKDWKTGEKYQSAGSASTSADSLTAVEEDEEEIDAEDIATQNDLRHLSSATLHDADRRHIEHSYRKIGSNGILGKVVAVQETRDPPKEGALKPPPSLRIVNTDIIPPAKVKFHNPWKHRNIPKPPEALRPNAPTLSSSESLSDCPAPDENDGWQTIGPTTTPTRASGKQIDASRPSSGAPKGSTSHATPKAPQHSLKPMRVGVIASMYQDESERRQRAKKLEQDAAQWYIQNNPTTLAPANSVNRRRETKMLGQERKKQLEPAEARLRLQTEEMHLQKLELKATTGDTKSPNVEQLPIESRKKKDRKKQREAERKARRAAENEPLASKEVDELLGDTEVGSPSSEVSTAYNVLAKEPVAKADQALKSPCTQGSISKVAGADVSDDVNGAHLELSRDTLKDGIQRLRHTMHAKKETPLVSWLHFLDPLLEVPPPSSDQAPKLVPAMLAASTVNKPVTDSVTTLKREPGHSESPKYESASMPLSISKLGRHKDWVKFAGFLKVDGPSDLLFSSMHPAYQEHADTLFIGGCPWEASGTPDCPYHKTYCACIDPVDPTNDKYIVYAETYPYQIGPFNCIQAQKLLQFFETQSETKDRLMLVDEDLYLWLCTEGRHWFVEAVTPKQMESPSLPNRLRWEVKDYVRGYSKGRILKLIDQFQNLADKNERLRMIGCRTNITEELLESLRKKCETRPEEEAICYCKDNIPPHHHPDHHDLVECMYDNCPIQFFHRRCVEKLGYAKVTTWYCAFCEAYMNVAAQKALHEADAIHKGLSAPDFADGKYGAQLRCVAAGIDMMKTGHCGGH
ncbi:hypothetical protein SLS60_008427 [Paraconiothyrium brasiliense]|uniref:Zinc finger PHD-type domain-containing protein n=1 Tax=Paraconiothyrium brasiliense TaxID=300254 RepID=A0ABR3R0J5_9PLEO